VLLLLAGVGGYLGLVNAYGPKAVLTSYLKAQVKGDVETMWRNARVERPDGSYNVFFDKDAFAATMRQPANRPFASFSIEQINRLNLNQFTASVSLISSSGSTTQTFDLVTDSTARHFLVYPSWKVVVRAGSVRLSLPNQAGTIRIDAIALPDSVRKSIAVIAGVHHVYMAEGPLLLAAEADVTAADSYGSVAFDGKLKPEVAKAAGDAVTQMFSNCDAAKHSYCIGHTYTAPNDGYEYFLKADDGSNVVYKHYTVSLIGDPTAAMTETIEAGNGQLSVSGSCTSRLTTDRNRTIDRKGTFDGRLAWNGTRFAVEYLYWTC
jgi:hypothetical protein